MKIYTTYFAKLDKLPSDIVPISIAAKTPSWYNGICMKELAPTYDILKEYKLFGSESRFRSRFKREILNNLNKQEIYYMLAYLSRSNDVALVCYERANDFCHRRIVADWLSDEYRGILVEELNI